MSSSSVYSSSINDQQQVKPVIIGLYGLPGSGKTRILNDLKANLTADKYLFFEGSEVLGGFLNDGLDGFRQLNEVMKASMRSQAIRKIQKDCRDSGKIGIVTGHLTFWPNLEPVHTEDDWDVYTHIIYLNVPIEEIARRVENDETRQRVQLPLSDLQKWQGREKEVFREECPGNDILFISVPGIFNRVKSLAENFSMVDHGEDHNSSLALGRVDDIIKRSSKDPTKLETIFVIDGDKTLAAEDTGELMWQNETCADGPNTLSNIFSDLQYTLEAFRYINALHAELGETAEFTRKCEAVAAEVTIHPELLSLLRDIKERPTATAITVTSGLHTVWQKVLDRYQLSKVFGLVGMGRGGLQSMVATPETKRAIVAHLQDRYGLSVWAIGDSPIDLPMMIQANHAIVAVGDKETRSKSMEEVLDKAVSEGQLLRARQVLLPIASPPRLDETRLPIIRLEDIPGTLVKIDYTHAFDMPAAKLLTGPTRDANISGNALREAHRRVGYYLSTEYLGEKIGLEEYEIEHVQGTKTKAHRLLDEKNTVIIPLLRGGEPMAFGVADAFPLAAFVHAKKPKHITYDKIKGMATVVLVDGVVNSGASAAEFVEHIRKLHPTIRIVIVAGVVQKEAIADGSLLQKAVARHGKISLVALRQSDNKFTGKGGTDTGHRLFNTTYLDD